MKADFTNGASVNRVYGDASSELLAVFQYDSDAREFAAILIARDAARGWTDSKYAVCNGYDGKLAIISHPKPETGVAA